jgi:nitric oxide reductase subunit C
MKPIHLFFALCFLFLIYTLSIYLTPLTVAKTSAIDTEKAVEGRIVWQKYNCQSCHQLYGLGGYLGPDLTNVVSNPKKGEMMIKQILKYGVKQMPAYNMSDEDYNSLIEFLKSADASGLADPRKYNISKTGMINQR